MRIPTAMPMGYLFFGVRKRGKLIEEVHLEHGEGID